MEDSQGIIDMRNTEKAVARKAAAAAAQEPEAALCAAGSADAAGGNEDAAAAYDTAAKREANRTAEANAAIIVEPDSSAELRNKLLASTAGATGQHGAGKCPSDPSPIRR